METHTFHIDDDIRLMIRTDDPFLDSMTMETETSSEGVHVYMYGQFDDLTSPSGEKDSLNFMSSFVLEDDELTPGAVHNRHPSSFYFQGARPLDNETLSDYVRIVTDYYKDYFEDEHVTMEIRVLGAYE